MGVTAKETWKQIPYLKGFTTKNYAVSTHGRLASYTGNIEKKQILTTHLNGGFPLITVQYKGKSKSLFVHHAIGAVFLKKHSPKCKTVIHLDHNKANNKLGNLKWATKEQQIEHSKKSPYVLEALAKKVYTGATAKKLNEAKVTRLKKEIWNPKRSITLKQLAAKYDIAEMNLYRIKNGEMWFHVHVDGEPMHEKYKTHLKNVAHQQKATKKASASSATRASKSSTAKTSKSSATGKKNGLTATKKAIKTPALKVFKKRKRK